MEKIYQQIGQKVKRQRKLLNLTQENLAEKANLSPQYISRIERGVATPTLDALYNISAVLRCSIYQLLPESHDPTTLIDTTSTSLSSINLSKDKLSLIIEFLDWIDTRDKH